MRPKVNALMEKIGLEVEVNKSGRNKDMASFFRDTTSEETEMLQNMVNGLNGRFLNLVTARRKIDQKTLSEISSARIYLAEEAKKLGLVDEIGYLSDAVLKAKAMAGLKKNAKVVVYRRTEYPDDTLYNTSLSAYGADGFSSIFPNLSEAVSTLHTGFYYLWFPGN
jgi:protease-4